MSHTATASDAMDPLCVVVEPSMVVDALARRLDEEGAPGAVVVEAGKLVGVVTEMDLVFRNKPVHLPTFITILDAVIPFDPGGRAKAELLKATGATVGEIMTRDVISVGPHKPLANVATQMVEKGLSMVPVVENGRLLGIVTRRSAMRFAFRPAPKD